MPRKGSTRIFSNHMFWAILGVVVMDGVREPMTKFDPSAVC